MKRFSKTHLFLIELMIVIFFFSLASAVCVSLFVKSYLTSQKSENLNQALFFVQSGAECIKQSNGDEAYLLRTLLPEKTGENTYVVTYDGDWNQTSKAEDIQYVMTLSLDRKEPDSLQGTVVMNKQDNQKETEIYRVEVSKYLGTNP